MHPSEGRRDLSEVGKLVSQALVQLDINSKSDVGEARSWLKYAKDPVAGAITSVPAPQYFSGLTCAGGTRATGRTSMHRVNLPIPAGDNIVTTAFCIIQLKPNGYCVIKAKHAVLVH